MDNANSSPLVSIITLTYNRFEKLIKTIDSVFEQNYCNLEYIICDDGSNQFPTKIIEQYCKVGKQITLIKHSNIGTVKNFNMAIKQCHGKYIIPLSANDYFASKEAVDKIVEKFEKTKANIITAKMACIADTGEVIEIAPKKRKADLLRSGNNELIFRELCVSSFISGACTYYSREIISKYDGFNEKYRLIEDFPFYAQFLLDGGRIEFLDEITINYDLNGISSNKKLSPLLLNDRKRYYQEFVWNNISGMPHIQKQELRFRYLQMCGSNNKIIYLLQLFSCIDFICIKVIKKIFKME